MIAERLLLVTPFDESILALSEAEQLVMLKGCALCQITRAVDDESVGTKDEWKTCRNTLGVRVESVRVDQLSRAMKAALSGAPPAVLVETPEGFVEVLRAEQLDACKGSVSDFRGRLFYRLAAIGVELNAE